MISFYDWYKHTIFSFRFNFLIFHLFFVCFHFHQHFDQICKHKIFQLNLPLKMPLEMLFICKSQNYQISFWNFIDHIIYVSYSNNRFYVVLFSSLLFNFIPFMLFWCSFKTFWFDINDWGYVWHKNPLRFQFRYTLPSNTTHHIDYIHCMGNVKVVNVNNISLNIDRLMKINCFYFLLRLSSIIHSHGHIFHPINFWRQINIENNISFLQWTLHKNTHMSHFYRENINMYKSIHNK